MERHRVCTAVTCIFFSLLPPAGGMPAAETPYGLITIGEAVITVPPPAGFREVSTLAPDVRELSENATPASNRLLGVYLSGADVMLVEKGEIPLMERYMYLQTFRATEAYPVAPEDFAALTREMRAQRQPLPGNATDGVNADLDELSRQLSSKHSLEVAFETGKPVPLGVYLDRPDALGMAMLVPYVMNVDDERADYVMVTGINVLRLNNKLVYAYVYSLHEDAEDVEWVRRASIEWANALQAANPHVVASAALPSGIVTDAAVDDAFAEAVIATLLLLAGVVVLLRKWRAHVNRKSS